MPNRQAQCQRAWRQSRQVAPLQQDCNTGSSHYAGGILTLILTSFNLYPIKFYGLLANFAPQIRAARFHRMLRRKITSPRQFSRPVRAKVMGRLFFLESFCVTQPLMPSRLHQRLFCVPSCRIFTFVSGHCWLPMRGDGFSMADFFMSGGLTAPGFRLKESGSRSLGSLLTFRLFLFLTF